VGQSGRMAEGIKIIGYLGFSIEMLSKKAFPLLDMPDKISCRRKIYIRLEIPPP